MHRANPGTRIALLAACALVVGLAPRAGEAHAFLDHSEPRVGHTVDASPPDVRIWFDEAIEPGSGALRVENAQKQRVDRGDPHVDASDPRLLEVSLPPLPPGKYEVQWSAVARDGHRSQGSFSFAIRASSDR